MTVSAVPTWFGRDDESLFGCVHLPADGRVRGAVIICSPLAEEATRTQPALRALAVSLAERGVLALRFDYLGTGDSAVPASQPGALERWLHSIAEAHRYLVDTGLEHIALVGLRTGALLAMNALDRLPDLAAVGLWDPTSSGRSFLRREQALYSVSVGQEAHHGDDVIEGVGISFDRELRSDLHTLTLDEPAPQRAPHITVFDTAATMLPGAMRAALAARQVEFVPIGDSYDDGPYDVSFFAGRLPTTAIRTIADWADARLPAAHTDNPVQLDTRSVAIMTTADGAVRETLLAMPRDPGPGYLHGIISEPIDRPATGQQPVAMLLNISVTGRAGPSRSWVSTARRAAAGGTAIVRYDRYGLGESVDDTVGYVGKDFDADAVDDVSTVARFVRPQNPSDVTVAGLCSGAWAAAMAAPQLRPRHLILMNLNRMAWTAAPLPADRAHTIGVGWVIDPDPRSPPRLAARVHAAIKWRLRHLPRALSAGLKLIPRPARVLDALPPETSRVTLMLCDADFEDFVDLGGLPALRRRGSSDPIELSTMSDVDHGLIGRPGREQMLDELVAKLCRA